MKRTIFWDVIPCNSLKADVLSPGSKTKRSSKPVDASGKPRVFSELHSVTTETPELFTVTTAPQIQLYEYLC
jgi:hypothetical protein